MPGNEGAGGQFKDQAAVHLLVEVEVEVVECLKRVAELGLLAAALQHAVGATGEFVGDQTRDQIQRGHRFGLSLPQTGFQHRGHTSQAQLS
jgi:hypothetical protein